MVNKTIATSYPWERGRGEGERGRGKGICNVTYGRIAAREVRRRARSYCCKEGEEKSQKLVQCGESGRKGMAVNLCCMKRVCKRREEIECCMHELENVW